MNRDHKSVRTSGIPTTRSAQFAGPPISNPRPITNMAASAPYIPIGMLIPCVTSPFLNSLACTYRRNRPNPPIRKPSANKRKLPIVTASGESDSIVNKKANPANNIQPKTVRIFFMILRVICN